MIAISVRALQNPRRGMGRPSPRVDTQMPTHSIPRPISTDESHMPSAMIEVTGLTKRYRDRVAVDDLTFSVPEGEILGFLGPNGAGKSTTMKVLTGYLPASSGTVKVAGHDVFEEPYEVKRRIGYLPETPPLYPEMSVRGYLRFVASLKGVTRGQMASELDRVAHATGITEVFERLIQNLSKGFRQRVGLAQALLGSPPVLILDEPTEGLDPSQRAEVRQLIKGLAGQHTVILSTHILPEVTMTCARVLILNQGKMVAFDEIQNLAHALGQGDQTSLEDIFLKLTAAA
jgi:ABC-2 type transport system ATP-binding protein